MPNFKFSFERDYTIREGFDRVIEAETLEEAQAIADRLASEFNMDCPDDCSESDGGEATDFEAVCPPPYQNVDDKADYNSQGEEL